SVTAAIAITLRNMVQLLTARKPTRGSGWAFDVVAIPGTGLLTCVARTGQETCATKSSAGDVAGEFGQHLVGQCEGDLGAAARGLVCGEPADDGGLQPGEADFVVGQCVALPGRRFTPQDRFLPNLVHFVELQRLQQAGGAVGDGGGPALERQAL